MATWIGKRLRRARLEQGLAQGVLAEKVGVSQPTISNWEQGKGKPDGGELRKLEAILGEFNRARGAKGDTDASAATEGRAFGDWLRSSRESAKLSVHELAAASGCLRCRSTTWRLAAARTHETRRSGDWKGP